MNGSKRWGRLIPICLLGALACGGEEGRVDMVSEPDASSDGGTPLPGPDGSIPRPVPDGGSDGKPCPCTFVEEFDTPSRIDGSGTTATVDDSGSGALRAAAAFSLQAAGAGGEGALSVTTDRTLTPGTHEYTSLDISGAAVRINGDATLRVSGPVNLRGGASLVVAGRLTLVASGNIVIDCSRMVSTGDLVVHQGGGDFTARCATAGSRAQVLTDLRPTGNSGSIAVWTRGALRLGGSVDLYSGNVASTSGRSGSVDLRAYADVAIGPGDGMVVAGGSAGENGDFSIASEGRVTIEALRVAGGESTAATSSGGDVEIHARGPVALRNGGNLLSSPGGSIVVFTESALTLENTSFILTANEGTSTTERGIHLRARSLRVGSTSTPGDRSAIIARAGARRAASLRVEVLEDVELLEEATVGTNPVDCLPAGDVTIAAERNVRLSARALLKAGDSRAGAGCSAGRGGTLSVAAAGNLENAGGVASGGIGAPNGATDVGGDRTVRVGVLAAELVAPVRATSVALPLEGTTAAPTLVGTSWGTSTPAQYPGLHLAIAEADDFVPVRHSPRLAGGWRYRVLLEPRMFDAVSLDSFTVRY